MNKTNLKNETLLVLMRNGKQKDDIVWVGTRKAKIPVEKFWELADVEYDSGYGWAEVAKDLIVVGKDWWLERAEYDGSEWWEFKTFPIEPTRTIEVNKLICDDVGWCRLEEMQEEEE